MNRRQSIRTFFAMSALIIGSSLAFGHNGVEHVMGTVSAVTESSITVDTVKHTTVTVMVDAATTFTHQDMKMALSDLKVGEKVVINAKETADKKLQGIFVKWGAVSTKAGAHTDHKM